MDLGEQLLESVLEGLVLVPLVELADKMPAGFQGIARKGERRGAEVLGPLLSDVCWGIREG